MTVKIMINRQFKEPLKAEDIRVLNDLRIRAMGNVGYISGETLVELDDNRKIMVLSVWSSLEDWQTWMNSRERGSLEEKLSRRLEGSPQMRTFKLGADSFRELLSQVVHEAEVGT